jgi:hypothetical protein
MYAITAQVETYDTDANAITWRGSRQLPTFYLDENVQGIRDERHATRIARQILDPFRVLSLRITAEKIR